MLPFLPLLLASTPPAVTVDRDNVEITASCTVRVAAAPILDADGNGVIHIAADGVTVDFAGALLHGALDDQAPDTFNGIGVRIAGRGVTLRNARVSGFKAGIRATGADGLVVEDCDVSGNFRHRLRSTPEAEDASDWLWPHANDANEWLAEYGAGLYVEDAEGVTIRRVRARRGQNGIILDRVERSKVYDNDCSFLSGWGLALWRSDRNVISRNAFDFCIRGYSHGVYNRGQDSAGILMFEQCSENTIAENSATHGGDGLFAFAGKEALGGPDPAEAVAWYEQRGHRSNLIIGNDFSFAAAHGIELTFSFFNQIFANRLEGNAICGIWGGYSQQTTIASNDILRNGEMGYGHERGGINIEHGHRNFIEGNAFAGNKCGVYLWWDEDEALMQTAWARANERGSADTVISGNTFEGDEIGVQLRRSERITVSLNTMSSVGTPLDLDAESEGTLIDDGGPRRRPRPKPHDVVGETRPAGARPHLRGRDKIVMTEWGPYDWESPYLHLIEQTPGRRVYELLGAGDEPIGDVRAVGDVDVEGKGRRLVVTPRATGTVTPFELSLAAGGRVLTRTGAFVTCVWDVRVFPSPVDPREDAETWRAAAGTGARARLGELDLRYGSGSASNLPVEAFRGAGLPRDHFGTIATTTLAIPAGRWRLRSVSDDGIRVFLDGTPVIDDWTWHPPKEHEHVVEFAEPTRVELRVEHFELDGYSILSLDIEPVE